MHLLLTNCKNTSSDADRPTLLNIAFTDRWKERFALSREHFNLLQWIHLSILRYWPRVWNAHREWEYP